MPTAPAIDWEDLTNQHNKLFRTDYNDHIEMLRDLYEELNTVQIAKRLSISHTTVAYYLKRSGIQLSERKPKKKKYNVRHKKTIAYAICNIPEKELKELTTFDLAKRFKTNPKYIRRIALKYNLPINTNYPYVGHWAKEKHNGKQRNALRKRDL